jgi:uracil phosphoribosyltransferase
MNQNIPAQTKPLQDQQFKTAIFTPSEREHRYGSNVHLLQDPFLHTHLLRLCSEGTEQPVINELIQTLYSNLLKTIVNIEFPQVQTFTRTRMAEHHAEASFTSPAIDPKVPVVCVNLARAGTLPSHVCYNALNYFMNPKGVRQDHVSIARTVAKNEHVSGSEVSGHKIGGGIEDAVVLFPDPMGATGSTIIEALHLYKARGKPKKLIAMHCIVTPEYLSKVTQAHPELIVYAIRLDRGLSPPEVLQSVPGTHWEKERGLNNQDYIVPGGGGFGEILNNAYV